MAQRQPNTENAGQRRIVPVDNLFAIATDSLVIELPSRTAPLLAWPRSCRASVDDEGCLCITERGRTVWRFAHGAWSRAGRLIHLRAEHRSVAVMSIEAAP